MGYDGGAASTGGSDCEGSPGLDASPTADADSLMPREFCVRTARHREDSGDCNRWGQYDALMLHLEMLQQHRQDHGKEVRPLSLTV